MIRFVSFIGIALLLSGCGSDSRQSTHQHLESATPTTTGSGTWTTSTGTAGSTILTFSGGATGSVIFAGSGSPPPSPPATPTSLTATATGPTTVVVLWNSSSGATSYGIDRAASPSGAWSLVYSGSATAFTDNGLAPGTTYSYEVSASNNSGTSALSASVSATTTPSSSGSYAAVWSMSGTLNPSTSWYSLPDSSGNGNTLQYDGPLAPVGPLGTAITCNVSGVQGHGFGLYPATVSYSPSLQLGTSGAPFGIAQLVYMQTYPGGLASSGAPGEWFNFMAQNSWGVTPDEYNFNVSAYCVSSGTRCHTCLQVDDNIAWNPSAPMATCGTIPLTPGQWHLIVVNFSNLTPTYF
jgi:hypothetical protein